MSNPKKSLPVTTTRSVLVIIVASANSESSINPYLKASNQSKWSETGEFRYRRCIHAVSLLENGNVIVTGAGSGYYLHTTELFHSSTRNWTNGAMSNDGRGLNDDFAYSNTAELYDPMTGTWKFVASMPSPARLHAIV
ncbi:unnamed protein product [Adineta ricciae]|uniref:Uncharacterized protein n=1 Tax=Adineta ricciae TaxID=249248 RepID=A0A814SS80_ADIRI|nr:unnamed protein product [Adineta ricciae]CAF1450844.1 unnamed protein product [Adineta ricciae]